VQNAITKLELNVQFRRKGASTMLKLIKMGGRIVRHARQIIFQLAEVMVPRELFAAILERVSRLGFAPG